MITLTAPTVAAVVTFATPASVFPAFRTLSASPASIVFIGVIFTGPVKAPKALLRVFAATMQGIAAPEQGIDGSFQSV